MGYAEDKRHDGDLPSGQVKRRQNSDGSIEIDEIPRDESQCGLSRQTEEFHEGPKKTAYDFDEAKMLHEFNTDVAGNDDLYHVIDDGKTFQYARFQRLDRRVHLVSIYTTYQQPVEESTDFWYGTVKSK